MPRRIRRRARHRQVQGGADRPLRDDDAGLRAVHRRGARRSRAGAERRRAVGPAGPRRDHRAPVGADGRLGARAAPLPRRPVADGLEDRPATSAGSRRRPRAHVQPRDRDRVLPRPEGERDDRAREPQGHAGQGGVRHRRAAREHELHGRAHEVHERPRLGRPLVRPRGRQQSVRVRLLLHRRAGHGRPPDPVAHDDQDARAQVRLRGHVHAEAVRRPDRQRRSLQHVAGRSQHRGEPVRRSRRPAGLRRLDAHLPVHRRRPPPRAGDLRDHRLDRQLVQAADQDRLDDRDSPGRRCTCPTGTTTARTCCGFR